MHATVDHQEWARQFARRPGKERQGAYDVELANLPTSVIAELARHSGIHPDVLGPLRRAAVKLNWIIMVRPIKPAAMHYVGEFDKLPKPMEIKTKCHPNTAMVMFENDAALQRAIGQEISPSYAKANGLQLEAKPVLVGGRRWHYLVNRRGQKFFSDMDLYEVLHGSTGRQVQLGRGESENQGLRNRRELDTLINLMRRLGTSFALIQHGPARQWVAHDPAKPNPEPITVFCADGEVLIVPAAEVGGFIKQVSG